MISKSRRLSKPWSSLFTLPALCLAAGCATDPCQSCHHGRPPRQRSRAAEEVCYEEPWQEYARRIAARPQAPFFGYQHTCWHEWPQGGPNCEPCSTAWGVDTPLIGPFPGLPVSNRQPETLPPPPPEEPAAEDVEPGSTETLDLPRQPITEPTDDESTSTAEPAHGSPVASKSAAPGVLKTVKVLTPPAEMPVVIAAHTEPESEPGQPHTSRLAILASAVEAPSAQKPAFQKPTFREQSAHEPSASPALPEPSLHAAKLADSADSTPVSPTGGAEATAAAASPAAHRNVASEEPAETCPAVIALCVNPAQEPSREAAQPPAGEPCLAPATNPNVAPAAANKSPGKARPPKRPVRIVRILREEPTAGQPVGEAAAELAIGDGASDLRPATVEMAPGQPRWRAASQ